MSRDETGVHDASVVDSPEVEQAASEGHLESADARAGGCRRNRVRPVLLLMSLALIPLAAWRLHADRQYWAAAWAQGTLFPEHATDDVQFAQSQGARGPAFDLKGVTVPVGEIHSGGPPKDGIPALTNPKLIAGTDAAYLRPEDRVIGVVVESEARAYPLRILNYHEIVNDRVGKLPIAVTYCPLCDSAAVFDRRTPLGEREFGVSGLLYNSNVLMYDRGGQPESLWSQVKTVGISGPAADKSLAVLPVELTTWKDWLARYPRTKVLSDETGHRRDYRRSPYAGYFTRPELMFPAKPTSDRLPTKSPVLGVWTDGAARGYPASAFGREAREIKDMLGGKSVLLVALSVRRRLAGTRSSGKTCRRAKRAWRSLTTAERLSISIASCPGVPAVISMDFLLWFAFVTITRMIPKLCSLRCRRSSRVLMSTRRKTPAGPWTSSA